ncbi:17904_t:CDS:2, partial [Racocetra persica]
NVETWWQPEEKDCKDDQEWENNWYNDTEECEVFMIKVENSDSEEETIKLEPEDYSPALRFFNNGVPGLGLLTSPFPNPRESTRRRFIIEEYRRELEYRELVLEVLESDDESTQSRDMVTPSETESENGKENANPKTDKEGDDEFWYCHDDDETVITQEEEDGCREISEEKEVFMIKMENKDEQKEGIEVENILPGSSERILTKSIAKRGPKKDLSCVLPPNRTRTLHSGNNKQRQDHILDRAIRIPTYGTHPEESVDFKRIDHGWCPTRASTKRVFSSNRNRLRLYRTNKR